MMDPRGEKEVFVKIFDDWDDERIKISMKNLGGGIGRNL